MRRARRRGPHHRAQEALKNMSEQTQQQLTEAERRPVMATKRSKPSTALPQLHERLDRVTGDGTCVALILPLIGLAMRCTRSCARCGALAAEVERLRPEWDRARDEYRRANADPKRPPTQRQARP
jgi:hypothetical protein